MNLIILRKEKNIDNREKLLILFGILGEAKLILRIRGANAKYIQGAEDFLSGIGEINALLSAVCDCSISWSYSRFELFSMKT